MNRVIKIFLGLVIAFNTNAQVLVNSYAHGDNFNPLDLGSKVEFWFDNTNESNITLINTNEVDSQVDETGNFTRLPDTDSNGSRPTYDATRNEIYFDGSAFGLVLQEALSASAKAGGEIFVVMRRVPDDLGTPTPISFFGASDSGTTNRQALLQDGGNIVSNHSTRIFYRNGATVNSIYGNVKILSDKTHIFNFRINPGTDYILDWDDRGAIGETATSGADDGKWIDDLAGFNRLTFAFFNQGATKNFQSYYEKEILYCNTILTSDERADVYDYFNRKHSAYALTFKHIGIHAWGQSNMVGQGDDADRPNRYTATLSNPVKVWTATNTFSDYTSSNDGGADFGMDLSLVYSLSEYYKNTDVYLMKLSEGGTGLADDPGRNDWNISTGELYDDLETRSLELQTALDGLGTNIIISILIQGERDVSEAVANAADDYYTHLNEIYDELATAGFTPDYYIIHKLNDDIINVVTTPPITQESVDLVQQAEEDFVDDKQARGFLVDLDLFEMIPNDAHYPSGEYLKIGEYNFSQVIILNNL